MKRLDFLKRAAGAVTAALLLKPVAAAPEPGQPPVPKDRCPQCGGGLYKQYGQRMTHCPENLNVMRCKPFRRLYCFNCTWTEER